MYICPHPEAHDCTVLVYARVALEIIELRIHETILKCSMFKDQLVAVTSRSARVGPDVVPGPFRDGAGQILIEAQNNNVNSNNTANQG